MTKVLVLSDSHGNIENMKEAVRLTRPDRIFHLGDCISDAEKLHALYPEIPMDAVPGNCDYCQDYQEKILIIEGHRMLICHGHAYGVKRDYLTIAVAAREKEVEAVFFGHTHVVCVDHHNGIKLYNPGSIGAPFPGNPPSYGILTIEEKPGEFHMQTAYLKS